jgi:hypothetical protein
MHFRVGDDRFGRIAGHLTHRDWQPRKFHAGARIPGRPYGILEKTYGLEPTRSIRRGPKAACA